MNRLHVHLKVSDLDKSIGFYSALFGRTPDKREADYAKWMLEDPRANIAISSRGAATGVDHVGLQVETHDELEAIATRLKDAGIGALDEPNATCCYARSDKYWALSPDGAKWELYRTFGDSPTFGASPAPAALAEAAAPACCA
jgi:catechol 2,3-dioxygenase-like lactoylglutathione lyase family enzyme